MTEIESELYSVVVRSILDIQHEEPSALVTLR
jgi:hypothetical protein